MMMSDLIYFGVAIAVAALGAISWSIAHPERATGFPGLIPQTPKIR